MQQKSQCHIFCEQSRFSQPTAIGSPRPGPGDEAGLTQEVEGAPLLTPVTRIVVVGPAGAPYDNLLSLNIKLDHWHDNYVCCWAAKKGVCIFCGPR